MLAHLKIKTTKKEEKKRKNIRCYLAQGDACFPNRFYQPRQLTYFIRLVYDILHTIIALIKHILLLIVLHFCFVFTFTICKPFQKFVLVVKKIADNELYVFPLVVRFVWFSPPNNCCQIWICWLVGNLVYLLHLSKDIISIPARRSVPLASRLKNTLIGIFLMISQTLSRAV